MLPKGTPRSRSAIVIFVSVGTFVKGFDDLVCAADEAAASLQLEGFAQIGHSDSVPKHLHWKRFLDGREMQQRLQSCSVVVCHGGVGIIGDAMRAGRPILAMPRQGMTSATNPANDQRQFVEMMSYRYGIHQCLDVTQMTRDLRDLLAFAPTQIDYRLETDIPQILAGFLRGGCSEL